MTDHSSDSLCNSRFEHLIKFGDIHAQIVYVVAFHVDIEDHGYVNLHENIVACGAGSDWLIENYILLRDKVLSLCPRKAIVLPWLPDTKVLTVLCHTGNDTFGTINIRLL